MRRLKSLFSLLLEPAFVLGLKILELGYYDIRILRHQDIKSEREFCFRKY